MLFSAWHAVTQAPHPVQESSSTAIPHRGIYKNSQLPTPNPQRLPVWELGIGNWGFLSSPLFDVLAHAAREQNEPAVGIAGPRDADARGRPRERAGGRLGDRREHAHRILSAAGRVAREHPVPLPHG